MLSFKENVLSVSIDEFSPVEPPDRIPDQISKYCSDRSHCNYADDPDGTSLGNKTG